MIQISTCTGIKIHHGYSGHVRLGNIF